MDVGERILFDLNEVPAEDDGQNDPVNPLYQEKGPPSVIPITDGLVTSLIRPKETNNHKGIFGHRSLVSPNKASDFSEVGVEQKRGRKLRRVSSSIASKSSASEVTAIVKGPVADAETLEREEGELTETDISVCTHTDSSLDHKSKGSMERGVSEVMDCGPSRLSSAGAKVTNSNISIGSGQDPKSNPGKNSGNCNSESKGECDTLKEVQEEPVLLSKQKQIGGMEASHVPKSVNNVGQRKIDQHKQAMLGKKRSRQTMFLDLDDIKQAGPIKSSTPRKPSIQQPLVTRTVKETRAVPASAEHAGEIQTMSLNKDHKQVDLPWNDGSIPDKSCQKKSEYGGDMSSGTLKGPRKLNGDTIDGIDRPTITKQSSGKHNSDSRQIKSTQFSNRRPVPVNQNSMDPKFGYNKLVPFKKATIASTQYNDTSVERLIREVTNEKLWHHTEETELQSVPGRFESLEDYVRVFEPLLFEECRAQLFTTWEELSETNAHVNVRIKSVERRERGWYDAIVLHVNEGRWAFKEGEVAVLSIPESDGKPGVRGRVAGTVRRHIPLDTRDPPGAILHFYVGDTYDHNSNVDDHILGKLQPRGIWHLTVLGSLATTQREYVALHAFSRLNSQMQSAILKPSADHFPNYELQIPVMPESFTQKFADHLKTSFNSPQLAAIHWAAMHTAAGTSNGLTKRQDPWPFTLVQGPPGTGKTHTVWGMLNVIHLVQYQHYYTALLKKLAPESYIQASESNLDSVISGSIDEVLQNMDQNLFRTLPKLCPKPRMLVCAPSNAATDELLSRVLDRGFIDGEMKVYRPDVARVGVDTQTRAAQAVSVERRTEQLLGRSREEILGHMQYLRGHDYTLFQRITELKRKLSSVAAASRSQGSVGIDPDVLIARDQSRDLFLQELAAALESRDKVFVEMSRLLIVEGKFRAGHNFTLEEARAKLEASFANEAEIVFTTVSSSGRKLFSRLTHGFDMVVIDEAAQASEVGVLPPLSLGAARCVLVGDPQQLPATVISKAAGTLMYSRSLFERFQQAGCPTLLLTVQYRMHPQIRDFPSRYFYQGRLSDSESVASFPDEIYYKDPVLRPYVFFDISHGRESHRGGSVSYENMDEARFCVGLYLHLQKTLKSLAVGKVSVGIITPYKLQLKCLKQEFGNVLGQEELKELYINTVDAFQGQERDVIIMSCVRASSHGVGFVSDVRRMNVALTRAKRALWVMGNANALMNSDDWAALITDAKARNCFMNMDSLPKEFAIPKGFTQVPGKVASSTRSYRSAGQRARINDLNVDSRPGALEDNKSGNAVASRNWNYRSFKPHIENSVDEFGPRGSWQYGMQNKDRVVGKRDS